MDPLFLFRRLPVAVAARLIWVFPYFHGIYVPLVKYRLHWLLFVSILYGYRQGSDSPPFTAQQFVLWFEDMPLELKAALIGVGIAALGFVFAFNTALESWRRQQWNLVRLEAAKNLRDWIFTIQSSIRMLDTCLSQVKKNLPELRQAECPDWLIQHVHEHVSRYWISREPLMAEWTTIYMESEKYRWVTRSVPGTNQVLDDAIATFLGFMNGFGRPMPSLGDDAAETRLLLCQYFDVEVADAACMLADQAALNLTVKATMMHHLLAHAAIGLRENKLPRKLSLDDAKRAVVGVKSGS